MAVIVNVMQCNSIVDVQAPAGASTGAVAQFPGPPINWTNRTVDPTEAVSWNSAARYAILTVKTTGGAVYARSAPTNDALAVGAGQLIKDGMQTPVIRNGSDPFLVMREDV